MLFWGIFGRASFLPFMEGLRPIVPSDVFAYFSLACFKFLMQWDDALWSRDVHADYFGETPAGTSVRVISQWMQHGLSGRFQMYDYGKEDNEKVYGCTTPPCYPLHKVFVPVAVLYGETDMLLDQPQLIKHLPNVVEDLCIPGHGHLDSLFAHNVGSVLYPRIVQLVNSHTNNLDG